MLSVEEVGGDGLWKSVFLGNSIIILEDENNTCRKWWWFSIWETSIPLSKLSFVGPVFSDKTES